MKQILLLIGIIWAGNAIGQSENVDEWMLFYLGGQSNMEGLGLVNQLPEELKKGYDDIYIFHGQHVLNGEKNGGLGIWEELKPGHGFEFSSDGNSNTMGRGFGAELTIGKRLKELYPGKKIALIKYARGGTKLDTIGGLGIFGTWAPGMYDCVKPTQTDYFINTVKNAYATHDINNDGVEDKLIPSGIFWMQGESDAETKQMALNYYRNLSIMMSIIRGVLWDINLPVVIGKISESGRGNRGSKVWKHGELVMYAQEQYVADDPNARIVRTTSKYDYSDPFHYDSKGYVDLGIRFAEEFYMLDKNLLLKRKIPKIQFLNDKE